LDPIHFESQALLALLQHFLRFDMLGKDYGKKIFQGVVTHIYKTNKSAVYCMTDVFYDQKQKTNEIIWSCKKNHISLQQTFSPP
jgi:hypothetical protein